MPSDFERSKWTFDPKVPNGKIVSLDELKTYFPETEDLSAIDILEDKTNYVVYGRKSKEFTFYRRFEAYECKKCKSIIVGMPRIDDDLSFHEGMPLAGRLGWDMWCTNIQCSNHLDDQTIGSR